MKQFGKILKFELKGYLRNKMFVGITLFLGLVRLENILVSLLTAAPSLPVIPLLYPIFLSIGGTNAWNE